MTAHRSFSLKSTQYCCARVHKSVCSVSLQSSPRALALRGSRFSATALMNIKRQIALEYFVKHIFCFFSCSSLRHHEGEERASRAQKEEQCALRRILSTLLLLPHAGVGLLVMKNVTLSSSREPWSASKRGYGVAAARCESCIVFARNRQKKKEILIGAHELFGHKPRTIFQQAFASRSRNCASAKVSSIDRKLPISY